MDKSVPIITIASPDDVMAIDDNMLYHVAKDVAGKIAGVSMAFRNEDTQTVGAIYVAKNYYSTGIGTASYG